MSNTKKSTTFATCLCLGTKVPFFFTLIMLNKLEILSFINETLEGSDTFLVNLRVTPSNVIFVTIDADRPIIVDDCIALTRAIEGRFSRDEEDYELNVASPGADSPLVLPRQYPKHVGRKLSVATTDGKAYEGTLLEATDTGIRIRTAGTKKQPPVEYEFPFAAIVNAQVMICF